MGRNTLGRPLFVVFTLRRIGGGLVIRPISARYAHEGSNAMASKLKPFPTFASDAEAERFVETADLSQYDLMAGALPRDIWFARAEELYKDARITLRLPQAVVDAYKAKAAARRMPYQRLMRLQLQKALEAL
jgi:predicted DNA binding CopG/RHH family protein